MTWVSDLTARDADPAQIRRGLVTLRGDIRTRPWLLQGQLVRRRLIEIAIHCSGAIERRAPTSLEPALNAARVAFITAFGALLVLLAAFFLPGVLPSSAGAEFIAKVSGAFAVLVALGILVGSIGRARREDSERVEWNGIREELASILREAPVQGIVDEDLRLALSLDAPTLQRFATARHTREF